MLKEHLLTEVSNHVLMVTLNRPESLNAFSPDMIADLTNTIVDVRQKSQIRAIVIRGAGRSFYRRRGCQIDGPGHCRTNV